MKQVIFLFLLLTCSSLLFAQFNKKIASGRPGQANGPFGVGKNIYQLQSGLTYNNVYSESSNSSLERSKWVQNSIFRVGLADKTEARAGYSYLVTNSVRYVLDPFDPRTPNTAVESNGFEAFFISIRQNLFLQKGILPATGLQLTAFSPGFSKSNEGITNYDLKILLQHRLTSKLALNTNYSLIFNRNIKYARSRYVFSFRYTLTEKIGLVTEAYGFIHENNVELLFDAGLSFLINNNFQLDLFGGYDIDKNNPDVHGPRTYFISSGISYRLNKRD